jgi:hypothetical protein
MQASFPSWKAKTLASIMKPLEASGLDLLDLMLVYDPAKRSLLHPYFASLDKMTLPAKPGEYQIKAITGL